MPGERWSPGISWFIVAAGALAGCSAYDADLLHLEASDGPALTAQPMPTTPTPVKAATGGSPAPDSPDPPREPHCGDGRVEGDELCDSGIPEGRPGACPTSCPPLSECELRALRGSGCDATCVLLPEECAHGDGCCPAGCIAADDDDCSQSCGDGEVQPDEQETCEDGSDTPCPTEADCDDGDACTEDALIGSAQNCNAHCTHTAIEQLVAGDGCCPEGANANDDADCKPVCGNAVREAPEECDGVPGCSDQCIVTETPAQLGCIDSFADNDCLRCACISCTAEVVNCMGSDDPTRDAKCQAIDECAREADCVSTPCYCGDSLLCLAPNGPCKDVIESAASVADPLTVDSEKSDPNTAIGRANLLALCSASNCSDVCP